ncbi:MAG: flagellar protein FliT [Polyangiales bacterium]
MTTSRLEELVEWLEHFTLDAYLSDPEHLVDVLAERQPVLTEIEKLNTSKLDPAVRTALKARLEAVLARDEAVLEALRTARAETQKSLEQVSSGRAAVRGYGAQSSPPGSSVRRVG